MVDYPYAGILVADAVTFRRATNAAVTVYDVNDMASANPLVLKDLSGLPLPNPLTSTSDGFVRAFVTTSEGVKLVGGGLTVVEYSHKGIKDAAVAAAGAAQGAADSAATAAGNALSTAAVDGSGQLVVTKANGATVNAGNVKGPKGDKGDTGTPGSNVLPTDDAIEAAVLGTGTKTKAALSATYVNLVSIKKFADGVGTGSELTDTGALLAAMNAAGSSGTVYFPAGNYKISSWPAPVNQATFRGDGESSVITYSGTGTMATLTNRSRVKFSLLKFSATDPNATLFTLSNSFRCSFVSCVFQGLHTPTTGSIYRGQTAVRFVANAGDTLIHDCDILNFGKGIWTETIQNFMSGSKVGTCYYGIYGDTGAGFSVTQTDFVSAFVTDGSAPPVASNIYIPGTAGQWWLEGVWMEGADVAVKVGTAGVGGPTQFGMVNCKIAATTKNVDIQNARQPYMANVQTSENPGTTPTPYIVASTVTEGTAINLVNIISGATYHLPDATFPVAWTVLGRGRVKLPTFMTDAGRTPLSVAANTGQTADLAQFVDAAGLVRTWIDSQGFIAIGGQGSRNTARANFGSNGEMRITPCGIAASGFTNNIATDDIAFALAPRAVGSRAMVVRGLTNQTADLAQFQAQGGTTKTAVNAGGVLIADDATSGIILKSPNGHYWRQTISDTGVIAYADLGTTRPTA